MASNPNTNLKLTVESWAYYVIKEWLKKIVALDIHQTGALARSFHSHVVTAANGDPTMIWFVFEWYGKMVDIGVGKGLKLVDRDAKIMGNMTDRTEKPWFTDVFWKQLEVLRHLLEEKNALHIERFMVSSFNNSKYNSVEI